MKERPILFSSPMVRAILEGRKTMTRRVTKLADGSLASDEDIPDGGRCDYVMDFSRSFPMWERRYCPYGKPGERLWVRETFSKYNHPSNPHIIYRADDPGDKYLKWEPSIFMPRWASRITLEITGVRVERINDISEEDVWAEGWSVIADMPDKNGGNCRFKNFGEFWDSINGERQGCSWEENPFVWVVEFRMV